jgi:ParB family transcriptional regulator, chromosome partitioning protein
MSKLNLKKIESERRAGYARDLSGLRQAGEAASRLEQLRAHLGKVVLLPLDALVVEDNVRQGLDLEGPSFRELVTSIEREGLLQNLVATLREFDDGTYALRVVSGQRRWHACKELGVAKVPVMLRAYRSQAEEMLAALAENINRVDLAPLDIAEGYRKLLRAGLSEDEIAERFDRGRRTIRKYIAIAGYPDDVKSVFRQHPGVFTSTVLFNNFASRSFKSEAQLREEVQRFLREETELSPDPVRRALGLGPAQAAPHPTVTRVRKKKAADAGLARTVIETVAGRVPVKVSVKGTSRQGRIVIDYHTADQLKEFLACFKRRP